MFKYCIFLEIKGTDLHESRLAHDYESDMKGEYIKNTMKSLVHSVNLILSELRARVN